MRSQIQKYPPLLLLLLLVVILPAAGQYRFDQMVKVSDHEDVRFRSSMKQGNHNFLWIATSNGLCRFDGQRFSFYLHDPDDPHSIFSNDVLAVLPVGDEIWAGTLQGVSVLNVQTQKFRNYQFANGSKADTLIRGSQNDVVSLFQDRQGVIWIGTRYHGLWKYNAEEDDFSQFAPDTRSNLRSASGQPEIMVTFEQSRTNDSIIWVGTSHGLMEINKYREEACFFTFPHEDKSHEGGLNFFRQLYHHTDGLLYTSHWSTGMRVFDPETKTLTLVEAENDPEGHFTNATVSNIIPKSEDEIWITSGYGLFLYSIAKKQILYQVKNDQEKANFYGVHLVDKDGRMWYTGYQGLFLYDPCVQQFHTYSFAPYVADGNVTLVFYQEYDEQRDHIVACPRVTQGLLVFDRGQKSWETVPFKNLAPFQNDAGYLNIYGFDRLAKDEYVLCGMQGLFRVRLGDNRLEQILAADRSNGTWFSSLRVDSEGNLWVGTTNAGLLLVDPNTGKYKVYQEDPSLPPSNQSRIDLLFEDSRRNIWIKRTGGLNVLIREQDRIQSFKFTDTPDISFSVVNAFAEDKYGHIWTCSEEGRIGYMEAEHPEKGVIEKKTIRDEGLEGHIYDLVADTAGNIWGSSTKDIFQIDGTGDIVSHFSLKYSSIPLEFFGMEILPDGQMVIGGRKEITLTYPKQLKRNQEIPVPYLTQISVKQRPIDNGYPVFDGQPLELKHSENFFSISYAAQAYTFGEDVRFRYRLHDLEDWVDAEDRLVANYTSVPPGEYKFQLMVANNEGRWNSEILEMPVTIHQAWYKSWWFLTLFSLFFASMVYAFFNYRVQQVRKEEKMKTNYEKKLASVEMSALVSQMNPHFLFNSLNSIDSYIIKNQSFKASEYLNSFARLMRLILQNSRSNYISLQNEIEGLELYLQMECLRSEGLFSYSINIDPEVDIHKIEIPPMLIQPYIENAIWHGVRHLKNGTRGRVDIHIAMQGEKLKVTVLDNGVGREKSAEIQKRKTGSHKRSMGMQITKSRIEMINKLYNADASVVITDLYNDSGLAAGTNVSLTIAI